MREDSRVIVHGDVTPANILFGDGPWVIAIDLERMKTADRVLDVGRVAGENSNISSCGTRVNGGGALHRPFRLGVCLPFSRPAQCLWEHYPSASLPWGDPAAHRPQHLDRCKVPAAALDEAKEILRVKGHGHQGHPVRSLWNAAGYRDRRVSGRDLPCAVAHYLSYQDLSYRGVYLHRWEVRDRYYEIMKVLNSESWF